MPIKIKVKNLIPYGIYAAVCVLINFAVKGIPLSLGLFFSFLICGGNAPVCTAIYILASISNLDIIFCACAAFAGIFLCTVTLIYQKTGKKIRWEALAYFCVAIAPYVIFAGTGEVIEIPFLENEYIIKSVISAICALFTFFCFKSVYALLYRLYRCRLREDELLCLAVVFSAMGVGLCRIVGVHYYFFLAAALIALFVRLFKSPSAIIAAIVLSIPQVVFELNFATFSAYILTAVFALLFVNTGRLSTSVICLICGGVYGYLADYFNADLTVIVMRATVMFVLCMICALPTDKAMGNAKDRLLVKKQLGQTAVSLCRERTGDRLYKISEVFREIECAFCALDEVVDDAGARRRMFYELCEQCCKNCARLQKCKNSTVYNGFSMLINTGCVKGKVSLIDLPSDITVNCSMPNEVIGVLNTLLSEYRRVMLDAENAKSGRALLANQARGVAEVIKSCAKEMCRTERNYTEAENEIKKQLAFIGISCPEIYLRGDEILEITAIICSNERVNKIQSVLLNVLGKRFILKNKTCLDGVKYCLEFATPTTYDAVFGVAYAIKNGEKVCGDTHSVIKINEKSFLMVLSDGMGSGEYAGKVSSTAISLIEAFYKAEMPEGTVLETINKLLSFSRDERFTCIDIGAINLVSGRADFVKIGSPAGIIVRGNEIKVLESNSLPLGILDNLRPTVATETLYDGDIVTFMSDGITSAFNSNPELYEFLQTLKPLNPQNLADKILAEALKRVGGRALDDMTVLCTRIFENTAK